MSEETISPLDILRGLVAEYPVLAQLVTDLTPYAPALARMTRDALEDLVETIQRKDFYAGSLILGRRMTDQELKALTEEARTRIMLQLAETARNETLLKEIALRVALSLAMMRLGAL